ncbi:MAG: FAD-dependent oxidoreductase [Candidatus Thermoplasmatota archaeon]
MRVVIAGGGFCGSILAKKFDSKDDLDTILIDENGFFEFYPSIPKLITEPSLESKIKLSLDSFLSDTRLVEEKLKRITPEFVETFEDKFEFDYLVICTGADYPIRLENTEDVFTANTIANASKINKRVESSESILIIGGGLIGVEVASELAVNTDKEICLVHPHSRLIERNPESASKYAEEFLEKRGVRLIFNDKVVRNEGDFQTENGKKIQADMAIWCAGLGFDRSFLHGFKDSVFANGHGLKVDRDLRLQGYDEIFVGGDITSVDEEKTGHNADRHAQLIYRNIIRHSKGKRLSKYQKMEFPLVISLGRKDGIFTFRSFSMVGPLPALLKYFLEWGGIARLRF